MFNFHIVKDKNYYLLNGTFVKIIFALGTAYNLLT